MVYDFEPFSSDPRQVLRVLKCFESNANVLHFQTCSNPKSDAGTNKTFISASHGRSPVPLTLLFGHREVVGVGDLKHRGIEVEANRQQTASAEAAFAVVCRSGVLFLKFSKAIDYPK